MTDRWTRYYDENFPGGIEVVRDVVRGSITIDDEPSPLWPPIKSKAEQVASLRWRASQKLEEANIYRPLARLQSRDRRPRRRMFTDNLGRRWQIEAAPRSLVPPASSDARAKIAALEEDAAQLTQQADTLAQEAASELERECERLMLEPARPAPPSISRAAKLKERLRQAQWMLELSRDTNLSGEPSAYSVGQVRRLEVEIAKFWDWSEE